MQHQLIDPLLALGRIGQVREGPGRGSLVREAEGVLQSIAVWGTSFYDILSELNAEIDERNLRLLTRPGRGRSMLGVEI